MPRMGVRKRGCGAVLSYGCVVARMDDSRFATKFAARLCNPSEIQSKILPLLP